MANLQQDFYLTLLSDNNLDLFPANHQGYFKNNITPIHLSEQTTVAVTDILIPFSFFNITNQNNTFFIHVASSLIEKKQKPATGNDTSLENLDDPNVEIVDDVDRIIDIFNQKIASMHQLYDNFSNIRGNQVFQTMQSVQTQIEDMNDILYDKALINQFDSVLKTKLTQGEHDLLTKANKLYHDAKNKLLPVWNGIKELPMYNIVFSEQIENEKRARITHDEQQNVKLKSAEHELDSLRKKIENLDRQYTRFRRQIRQETDKLPSIETKINTIEQEITILKSDDKKSTATEITKLQSSLQSLEQGVLSLKQTLENNTAQQNETIQTLQSRLIQLENQTINSSVPQDSNAAPPSAETSTLTEAKSDALPASPEEHTEVELESQSSELNVTKIKIEIQNGFYSDIPSLLSAIMKRIKTNIPWEEELPVFLDYKPHSRRIAVTLAPRYSIVWSDDSNKSYLGTMLGFFQPILTQSCIGSYEPSLLAGKDLLYVYCSIIEPQIVGNYKTQLLTIVPVNVQRNQYINLHYDSPKYLNVNQNLISEIAIEIRDSTGELITFEAGKVMLRLHFTNKP